MNTEQSVLERHYSPQEIGKAWGLSAEKVRQIFREFPGVVKLSSPSELRPNRKRTYVTLRIPASVLEMYHAQKSEGFTLGPGRRKK